MPATLTQTTTNDLSRRCTNDHRRCAAEREHVAGGGRGGTSRTQHGGEDKLVRHWERFFFHLLCVCVFVVVDRIECKMNLFPQ